MNNVVLPQDPNITPETISKKNIISELKKQVDDSKTLISSQRETIIANVKINDTLNEDCKRLALTIAELRDVFVDYKLQINNLTQQSVAFTEKEVQSTNQIDILNATIDRNRTTIATSNAKIEQLEEMCARLKNANNVRNN